MQGHTAENQKKHEIMKRFSISVFYTALVLMFAAGCAKEVKSGPNDASKRYIDAWIHVYNTNHGTDIQPTRLGAYVLEETKGDGAEITDNGYAIVEYKGTDLEGNITQFTSADIARQLGTYDTTRYYGPEVWLTKEGTIPAGVQESLVGMKVGGSIKLMVPSWLMTYSVYATAEEYLNQETESSDMIYEFTVKDFTDSIDVWQTDNIKSYIEENYGSLDSFKNDTVGFYYRQIEAPSDSKTFTKDAKVYINYTGKLLNGLVFDTTIEKVAKDNGLYNASRTYEPVLINWGENYRDLTKGTDATTIISGFARTLWQMKNEEKGIGIFNSTFGYGYNGSGSSIPSYAPLIFEIEIVTSEDSDESIDD